jgi:hypothetical protein
MGYLTSRDYHKQIQSENLNQVISNDPQILIDAETTAQSEIVSLISSKYDTSKEFRETTIYNDTVIYKSDSLVSYNGQLYYVTPPAEGFKYNKVYYTDDLVLWEDKVYTAQKDSPGISHSEALQYGEYKNIPYLNYAPDTIEGQPYWGTGTTYTITATLPTDTSKWTAGDNRNPLIVMYMIDVTLYHVLSRIAPRNIPPLRIDRYNAAVTALKEINDGARMTDIPLVQPETYKRFMLGGNVRRNNYY